MKPISGRHKEDSPSYEVTSDGRVKVNISKLLDNPKVKDFYKSIRQPEGMGKTVKSGE
jgi:hypothetical protein